MLSHNSVNSRIGERLKILSSRLKYVLNQLHYLKNNLLNEGIYKTVTQDPQYEAAMKFLIKKFPHSDYRSNTTILQPFTRIHEKILKELAFPYNTLVDALLIKENLITLIGEISVYQYDLNILLNYEMTSLFLDLISNYGVMLFMINEIPDVKQILVVYNLSIVIKFEQDENYYLRLCERFVEKHHDYNCMVEFHKEMNPYNKMIIQALISIEPLIKAKRFTMKEWDKVQLFKLIQKPNSEKVYKINRADLTPSAKIDKWSIFCCLSVYPELPKNSLLLDIFKKALENSFVLVIHRSLNKIIHSFLIKFFDSQKGNFSKINSMIKDSMRDFKFTIGIHKSRRDYLRMVIRHQLQVLTDYPGFIGPNLPTITQTLMAATDEIQWLIKHQNQTPSKKLNMPKLQPDELVDRQITELLYQTDELKYLTQQFSVVKTYFKKVLITHDIPKLKEFEEIVDPKLTENEMVIYRSFIETISQLENDPGTNDENGVDMFKSMHLDWLRLQSYLSHNSSQFPWNEHREVVRYINTTMTHAYVYSRLEKFLDHFCSLSFMGALPSKRLDDLFDSNMQIVLQHRYLIIFPRMCAEFHKLTTPDCSEDYNALVRSSNEMVHDFLNRISREICNDTNELVRLTFEMDQKLLPYQSLKENVGKKGTNPEPIVRPGEESVIYNIANQSTKMHEMLKVINNLSVCLNTRPFVVNNIMYYPIAYLQWELTNSVSSKLPQWSKYSIERPKQSPIAARRRPTEMMMLYRIVMSIVTRINEFININPSHVFTGISLAQALSVDGVGRETLSEVYSNWYLDTILTQPHIIYTPRLGTFIQSTSSSSKDHHKDNGLNVDEYMDINEMEALSQLLGPFGMKLLNEKLMIKISKNVAVLRSFVIRNQNALDSINKTKCSDYQRLRHELSGLEDVDSFVTSWRQIGVLFAFKNLFKQGVAKVTENCLPFLRDTVVNLQQDYDIGQNDRLSSVSEHEEPINNWLRNQVMVYDLCQAFGLPTKVDGSLYAELEYMRREQQKKAQQQHINQITDNDFKFNEFLMVATAYLFPNLVGNVSTSSSSSSSGSNTYQIYLESVDGNAHCVAFAIKEMLFAFFSPYGDDIMEDALKRFVQISSSILLRLGMASALPSQDPTIRLSREEMLLVPSRDSIYIQYDYLIQTFHAVPNKLYEDCFPYSLVRQAYHNVAKVQFQKSSSTSKHSSSQPNKQQAQNQPDNAEETGSSNPGDTSKAQATVF